jgi:hypothetical protein
MSIMTVQSVWSLARKLFSPEGVDRFVAAYQQTLRSLDLVDRRDPIAEIVAKKVIEIGKRAGDAIEISKLAVNDLGIK